MKEQSCWRCGVPLPPGSLTYAVHIKVFADFDGVLIEPEGGIDREMEKRIEQIKDADPETLERDVYEEFTLILCKSCRDRFMDETQHPWEGPFRTGRGLGGLIH